MSTSTAIRDLNFQSTCIPMIKTEIPGDPTIQHASQSNGECKSLPGNAGDCKKPCAGCLKSLPVVFFVTAIVSLTTVIYLCLNQDDEFFPSEARSRMYSSNTSDALMSDLIDLLFRTHYGLKKAKVASFLCYSTILGAASIGAILPWDKTVSLCVFDEDIIKVDERYLHTTLRRVGVASDYSVRDGFYRLHFQQANGTLTVFRKVGENRVKAGLETRLRLILNREVEYFPDRLAQMPFVNISLYGYNFSVPEESLAIAKNLPFKDLWERTKYSHYY